MIKKYSESTEDVTYNSIENSPSPILAFYYLCSIYCVSAKILSMQTLDYLKYPIKRVDN